MHRAEPLCNMPLTCANALAAGLGPIVSRTSDLNPVISNCAAFAVAAAAPAVLTKLLGRAPPPKAE